MDIHKENCLQENLINSDNQMDVTSIDYFKTCKVCKKSLVTLSEYKMHEKEHKKVTIKYMSIIKVPKFFFGTICY